MRVLKLALVLPLVAACQAEPEAPKAEGQLNLEAATSTAAVTYACEGAGSVSVTYDGERAAHVMADGQTYNLRATTAPRGLAYTDSRTRWALVQEDDRENATLTLADGTVRQCSRTANTAAPAPGLASCRSDQLQVQAEEIDAGMGHRNMPVNVSLKGQTGCLLPQWPQLTLLPETAAGGVKVEQTTDSYFAKSVPNGRIELKPGGSARFYMGWGVIPHEGEGETVCPEITGWRLKAPGGGELPEIATQIQGCGGKITISPFEQKDVTAARNG